MVVAIILTFLLLLSSPALAGHPAWEQYDSAGHIDYVIMNPNDYQQIWPDKTLRYCYSDSRARDIIEPYIQGAVDIWHAGGLSDEFQMKEIKLYECLPERAKTLYVRLGDHGFATSMGRQTPDGEDGPVMQLSLPPDEFLNHYVMVVHQIGHAWGLAHEHQNPVIWAESHTNPLRFHCDHIEGFPELLEYYGPGLVWGEAGFCTDYWSAAHVRWKAMQFLPLPRELVQTQSSHFRNRNSMVNWNSIMLYSSQQYAIPGQRTLVRREGEPNIEQNPLPSAGDVFGLKRLYSTRYGEPRMPLYADTQSPYYGLFQTLATSQCN